MTVANHGRVRHALDAEPTDGYGGSRRCSSTGGYYPLAAVARRSAIGACVAEAGRSRMGIGGDSKNYPTFGYVMDPLFNLLLQRGVE